LVDEFQDISMGRAKLLTALRNQVKDARLFCVGDDWQSIYRFAGSDIGLMTKFHEVFGYTKRIDLNRTFRFNDKIEALSTRFILKNSTLLSQG
jgi:DNA helicase IV